MIYYYIGHRRATGTTLVLRKRNDNRKEIKGLFGDE